MINGQMINGPMVNGQWTPSRPTPDGTVNFFRRTWASMRPHIVTARISRYARHYCENLSTRTPLLQKCSSAHCYCENVSIQHTHPCSHTAHIYIRTPPLRFSKSTRHRSTRRLALHLAVSAGKHHTGVRCAPSTSRDVPSTLCPPPPPPRRNTIVLSEGSL